VVNVHAVAAADGFVGEGGAVVLAEGTENEAGGVGFAAGGVGAGDEESGEHFKNLREGVVAGGG